MRENESCPVNATLKSPSTDRVGTKSTTGKFGKICRASQEAMKRESSTLLFFEWVSHHLLKKTQNVHRWRLSFVGAKDKIITIGNESCSNLIINKEL